MAHDEARAGNDIPKPDPALQRLARLVGSWRMKGRPIGSDEDSITGTTRFAWLHPGEDGTGFFLVQEMEMDYAGQPIRSHEVIGYDPEAKAFSSSVYSNMAPEPLPYTWDVQGDEVTICIRHGAMDATFRGRVSPDGSRFSGGWRPNPGADEEVNAPYDITCTRIA